MQRSGDRWWVRQSWCAGEEYRQTLVNGDLVNVERSELGHSDLRKQVISLLIYIMVEFRRLLWRFLDHTIFLQMVSTFKNRFRDFTEGPDGDEGLKVIEEWRKDQQDEWNRLSMTVRLCFCMLRCIAYAPVDHGQVVGSARRFANLHAEQCSNSEVGPLIVAWRGRTKCLRHLHNPVLLHKGLLHYGRRHEGSGA